MQIDTVAALAVFLFGGFQFEEFSGVEELQNNGSFQTSRKFVKRT